MKRLSEVKKIWETGKPVTSHEISEKLGLEIRSAKAHLIGLRKTHLEKSSMKHSGDAICCSKMRRPV